MTQAKTAPKQLIVNADDYGLTPGVSAGIRAAHRRGIVTSTTALPNRPHLAVELARARADCPSLGLGAHLVLTLGRPIRPAESVPSLVAPTGSFFMRPDLQVRLPELDPVELGDEWRAQIETMLAGAGSIDHLDSHHHVAAWDDRLLAVLVDLAHEYRLPIRHPTCAAAECRARASSSSTGLERSYVSPSAHPLAPISSRVGAGPQAPSAPDQDSHPVTNCPSRRAHASSVAHSTDHFIGSFYGENATPAALESALAALPVGSAELMCHPGFVDAELCAVSSYAEPRERELQILCDPRVRAALDRHDVTLATFADL